VARHVLDPAGGDGGGRVVDGLVDESLPDQRECQVQLRDGEPTRPPAVDVGRGQPRDHLARDACTRRRRRPGT
jgi:hypothetical protein